MRLTQDEFKAAINGDRAILRKIDPVIKMCARVCTFKMGANHLVDDVYQELWILFSTNLIHKFDATFALEPMLLASARLITHNEIRKQSRGKMIFMSDEDQALTSLYGEAHGESTQISGSWALASRKTAGAENDGIEAPEKWANEPDEMSNAMSAFVSSGQQSPQGGTWMTELDQTLDQAKFLEKIFRRCPTLKNVEDIPTKNNNSVLDNKILQHSYKTLPNVLTLQAEKLETQGIGNKENSMETSIASLRRDGKHGAKPIPQGEAANKHHFISGLLDEKLISKSLSINLVAAPRLHEVPDQALRQPSKTPAETPKVGDRLRIIRETLERTQYEMAIELNLKPSTYLSYEYTRVKKVPQSVLGDAELLLAQQGKESAAHKKYASMSMKDITVEWAGRLGVNPNDVTIFANRLGVNKSTISRWLRNEQKPNMREIVIYESDIQEIERRQEKREINEHSTVKARKSQSKTA